MDISQLDGQSYGVTLTLRDTPGTHSEWAALVARLHRAFREAGLSRWHWVVEWQRRGTPHLHLAVYAPDSWESPISDIMSIRLRVASAEYLDWPDPLVLSQLSRRSLTEPDAFEDLSH